MNAMARRALSAAVAWSLVSPSASAQTPQTPASDVTARSITAVGYQVGAGDTTIDLKGTTLGAGAVGEAKVEARTTVTGVEAKLRGLRPPSQMGTEFMAYVMWAVSPEGRAVNLGEIRQDKDGRAILTATTQLQSFSLFVTAEPYPAVRQPSEMLIVENEVRKGTKGRRFIVEDYKLMKRTQYQKVANPLALSMDLNKTPLELYQARNAVDIARTRGAGKYAQEIFSKAEGGLELAENALTTKKNKKDVISLARNATQAAEDARALTAERIEAERIAAERAAAAAAAKAAAEAKAAQEAAAAKERADEQAKLQAEVAAAREAQLKAEAAARQAEAAREAAQAKAAADAREAQLQASAAAREAAVREEAARAEAAAAAREANAKAEAERARVAAETLRAQLLEQFNRILETKDTVRGLVITMADVLFDTGKFDLRPMTREALARLSGIVLAHPGLKLEVEGHTDSTGSDALNQTLSEQRAGAVRGYLVQQGLTGDAITATGFGKAMPIADNGTAAGRQKNRRVELIVSGEVIGMKIGN
jgi:outer membrane protein OmpA-like peptidoglycan-associated protein